MECSNVTLSWAATTLPDELRTLEGDETIDALPASSYADTVLEVYDSWSSRLTNSGGVPTDLVRMRLCELFFSS